MVILNKQAEARQVPFTKAPHSVRHAPQIGRLRWVVEPFVFVPVRLFTDKVTGRCVPRNTLLYCVERTLGKLCSNRLKEGHEPH